MGLLGALFGSSSKSSTTQQTDARTVNDLSGGGIMGSTINIVGMSSADALAFLGRGGSQQAHDGAKAGGMLPGLTPAATAPGGASLPTPYLLAGGALLLALVARR